MAGFAIFTTMDGEVNALTKEPNTLTKNENNKTEQSIKINKPTELFHGIRQKYTTETDLYEIVRSDVRKILVPDIKCAHSVQTIEHILHINGNKLMDIPEFNVVFTEYFIKRSSKNNKDKYISFVEHAKNKLSNSLYVEYYRLFVTAQLLRKANLQEPFNVTFSDIKYPVVCY